MMTRLGSAYKDALLLAKENSDRVLIALRAELEQLLAALASAKEQLRVRPAVVCVCGMCDCNELSTRELTSNDGVLVLECL